MWVVRWLLALVIIVLILWFGWINLEQMRDPVTFKFWFSKYQVELQLILALFITFVLGALVWFPVAMYQFVHNKAAMRNLRKENSRLQQELADFRNMSIEEQATSAGEEENDLV